MNDAELNSIKEKFSIAYLNAIFAKSNLGLQKSDKDYDNFGIDYSIINKSVGSGRTACTPNNQINIQLKSVAINSLTMIRDFPDRIEYRVAKDMQPIGNFYLIVVVLPDDNAIDNWVEQCDEYIKLKKCAYYTKIISNVKPGFIKILKTNILTPDNVSKLFETV